MHGQQIEFLLSALSWPLKPLFQSGPPAYPSTWVSFNRHHKKHLVVLHQAFAALSIKETLHNT